MSGKPPDNKTIPHSILDKVYVASPCTADWEKMSGDERKRFCSQCQKNVFNISSMTKSEAETLINEALAKKEGLCIQYFQRQDGTILTEDCPVGLALVKEKMRRGMTKVTALIVGVIAAALSIFGIKALQDQSAYSCVKGEMRVETPGK